MSRNDRSEPLNTMERALANFSPVAPPIDRDRLMFLAGRASAEGAKSGVQSSTDPRSDSEGMELTVRPTPSASPIARPMSVLPDSRCTHWLWPASTAALAATSLALALALAFPSAAPPSTVVDHALPIQAAASEWLQPSEQVSTEPSFAAAPLPDREPLEPNGSYLKTRDVALRMGLDALGSPPHSAASASSASYRDLWLGFTSAPTFSPENTKKQTAM